MTTNGSRSVTWLRSIREPIAVLAWTYAIVKLFIFDVDLYILHFIAPESSWLLNLRLLALAALLAISWLLLGHRQFFLTMVYIVGYPFIIFFWKLPKLVWHHWATMLILLPSFYSTLGSLRFTFILYTAAAISVATIGVSRSEYLLIPAMLSLTFVMLVVDYRAFKSSQSSSVFSKLAKIIRGLHPKIISGEYDQIAPTNLDGESNISEGTSNGGESPQLPQLYMLHFAADFVGRKVEEVSKDRQYNSLLAISLLAVIAVTIFVFGMLNFALFKITPESFNGVGSYPFLQFIAYSMGRLATADLTSIQPSGPFSLVLALGEVFFGFVILVILVFSILTAARDAYREDFHDFEKSLHETASVIEDRIGAKYSLTAAELEIGIADTSREIVNRLRKLRGMPESESDESADDKSPPNQLSDGAKRDPN